MTEETKHSTLWFNKLEGTLADTVVDFVKKHEEEVVEYADICGVSIETSVRNFLKEFGENFDLWREGNKK